MSKLEDKILAWCRREGDRRRRTIGMRRTSDGICLVAFLDTVGGFYVTKWGSPVRPLQFDPEVVLAHGETWEEVAAQLGIGDLGRVVAYEEVEERMLLNGLGDPETTDTRLRARTACLSSDKKFQWMHIDVCASRKGGTLPAGIGGKIANSRDVDRLFRAFLGTGQLELREVFAVIAVTSSNSPLGFYVPSTGGAASTFVEPREVLRPALILPAPAIIVCHNHPSGSLVPSAADLEMTNRLREAGEIVGVKLLDHIILTVDGYTSFLDRGLLA